MPKRVSQTGSELFIVDNSEEDWKVVRYLHDWCQISKAIDVATGYFEIGSLISLGAEWQNLKRFLNEYMGQYAPREPQELKAHGALFKQTMQNIYAVFGDKSGRLYEVNPRNNRGGWDGTR